MRVAGSVWLEPIAAREPASGVITSTRLPCLYTADGGKGWRSDLGSLAK